MQAVNNRFIKLINGNMQFVIPVFQRDYSWTAANCQRLLEDVLAVGAAGERGTHFLGSVVYIATGDANAGLPRWLLIDGQQRVTTMLLLIAALRDRIRETNWLGGEDSPTAKKLDAYFLRNHLEDGDRAYKLLLRGHDQPTLRAILDGTPLPKSGSENLSESYGYFRAQLELLDPDLVYRGLLRIEVVDVTLDRNHDNPQLVFESLNSTGVELTQSDLVRNFILMGLPEKDQTDLYKLYWAPIEHLLRSSDSLFDGFLRDYLTLDSGNPKPVRAGDIYLSFQRVVAGSNGSRSKLEPVLQRLHRFARYYAAYRLQSVDWPVFESRLARLRQLADVGAILALRLFDCYDGANTLKEKQLTELLCALESYLVRRSICDLQSRGYGQVFAGLAFAVDTQQPYESLLAALERLPATYAFPADEDFEDALLHRDLYQKRICWLVLERLENHGSKETSDVTHLTIEHVLPQNEQLAPAWQEMLGSGWKAIQSQWLHRLGNLTLTAYNAKYSDRPFDEKKTIEHGFMSSSLRLNNDIKTATAWTESLMRERGMRLAKDALQIWPRPKVQAQWIAAAKVRELQARAERRDVAKVPMPAAAAALFPALRAAILDLDPTIVEMAEAKSVSYHTHTFFLEVLPRASGLMLLLALDFGAFDDPHGMAKDARSWTFFFYAQYRGGTCAELHHPGDVEKVLPLVRQAWLASRLDENAG